MISDTYVIIPTIWEEECDRNACEHVRELGDAVGDSATDPDAFDAIATVFGEYDNNDFITHVGEYMHECLDALAHIEIKQMHATVATETGSRLLQTRIIDC